MPSGIYRRTKKQLERQSMSMRAYFVSNPKQRVKISKQRKKFCKEHPQSHLSKYWGIGEDSHNYKPEYWKVFQCKECKISYRRRTHGISRFCSAVCRNRWLNRNKSEFQLAKESIRASKRICDPNDKFGKFGGGTFTKVGKEWYQSTWEYRCVMSFRKLGLKIERNSDRFPYVWKGRKHNYTPDFKLYYPQTNHFIFIEVKGWCKPVDIKKLKAVEKAGYEILMIRGSNLLELEKEFKSVS